MEVLIIFLQLILRIFCKVKNDKPLQQIVKRYEVCQEPQIIFPIVKEQYSIGTGIDNVEYLKVLKFKDFALKTAL